MIAQLNAEHDAIVNSSYCETTDLPGGVTGNDGYQNLRNSTRARLAH